MNSIRETTLAGAACALAFALSACGGGGGSGPTVVPAPPLTPTPPAPTPPPSPPPGQGTLDDAEYQASNSAVSHGALSAYQAGATGTGIKVAVIDTGINPNLPEFAGRIDPASQDVAANRGISDDQGHGSMVSGVIAANRDGTYMQGVAYNATILSLNVYDPAGCKPGNDCFLDDKIDEAIDLARTGGAKIINMSFGDEEGMTADVWPAIQRAVDAGMLIVMSAGNGGTNNPNGFALQNIQNNGGSGLFIIAGSMDSNRNISSFSDRAGTTAAAQHYLTALGRGNATVNHLGQHVSVNGTSFASPTIAGAAALLGSAFPNLSGAQIVSILLSSADDAGAAGVDPTFGRGILNITRAFQPQGATSLAGSQIPVSALSTGTLSAPMGDAAQKSTAGVVILDGYSRAYVMNVARALHQPRQDRPLQQAIGGAAYRDAAVSRGPIAVSITVRRDPFQHSVVQSEQLRLSGEIGREAKAVAGLAVTRLSPATALAYGFSHSGRALQRRLDGHVERAFLVAQDPMVRTGFHSVGAQSLAARHDFGPVALSVVGESGRTFEPFARRTDGGSRYRRMSIAVDGGTGPARFSVGASRLTEKASVLGASLSDPLSAQGSSTHFLDAELAIRLGRNWNAGGAFRRGWTSTKGGGLSDGGRLATNAWSFDLSGTDIVGSGDFIALRISQPLRVTKGALRLNLPTGYDFDTRQADYRRQVMNLAPSGREVDYELSFGRIMLGGYMDLHAFVRSDPGHFERSARDLGAAVRFTAR